MKNKKTSSMLLIGLLIVVSTLLMMVVGKANTLPKKDHSINPLISKNIHDLVTMNATLSQSKILQSSDGKTTLALTIKTSKVPANHTSPNKKVDMVFVIDKSGSMAGSKISYAQDAIRKLLSGLSSDDRISIVGYSDNVRIYSPLIAVTDKNKENLLDVVNELSAEGSTNLSAGLNSGIQMLSEIQDTSNARKVILISDGLANRGIVDPAALANIASNATEKNISISTVGVGLDFNEQLMTLIADSGIGNFYFLENSYAFADVFQQEFRNVKQAVASSVSIKIPLKSGVSVVEASGYPIKLENDHAIIHPGDLYSGQTRTIYLTLKIPTHKLEKYPIDNISLAFHHDGAHYEQYIDDPLEIACVKKPSEAYASIKKSIWSKKILQDDYNKLKEEVANDIKAGEEQKALDRIESYRNRQQSFNTYVGSETVAEHIEKDAEELRSKVVNTFQGAPSAVKEKQKKNSKSLQFESYKNRRDLKYQ